QVGIPDAGIACAVEEEIRLGVVGDPTPHRRSAELPLFGRPGSHAEIRALIFLVESVKAWSDLDVAIGSGVERAPQFFPAVDVETRHVSPDTELTAGVSNQDVILHDDRGRGEGLAAIDVANPRSPRFLARLDVH